MNDLYTDYEENDYKEILKAVQDKLIRLYKSKDDKNALNNIKKRNNGMYK
ncbi:hypothetical protein [Clostridium novyi]|nr:hypothetical protein [Clostridium novyi]